MCIEAKKLGIKQIIVPIQNAKEAAIIDEIEIYHQLQNLLIK